MINKIIFLPKNYNMCLFLVFILFSTINGLEYFVMKPCTQSKNFTVNYNECYQAPYKIYNTDFVMCFFDEHLINNFTSLSDVICKDCTSVNYTASFKILYQDFATAIMVFYDDLDCSVYSNNATLSIGFCQGCRHNVTGELYSSTKTYYNITDFDTSTSTTTSSSVTTTTGNEDTINNNDINNLNLDDDNSSSSNLYALFSLFLLCPVFVCILLILCIFLCLIIFVCILLIISVPLVLIFLFVDSSIFIAIVSPLIINNKFNNENIKIIEKLGEGSYGVVYKGKYNNKVVAIKEIKNEDDNIFNEIHLLGQLKGNNNVCEFIKYIENNDNIYIITKYYENGDLSTYMKNNKLEFEEKIKIIKDIVNGLMFLHKNNIIHRDLSCRNILLSEDKVAVISDFGFSRKFVMNYDESQKTLSNILPIRWSSPESIKDKVFSFKSDIYMLGCLIYELLTEEIPFKGNNIDLLAYDIVNNKIKLSFEDLDINYSLKLVFNKMTNYNPQDRPTLEYIKNILENYNNDEYLSASDIV